MPRVYDVLVAGGGPAGGAVAVKLAQSGRSVALIEASRYESPRVGETVPGAIVMPLKQLGIWEQFVASGHLRSSGTRSAWASTGVRIHEALYDPFGGPWHLDRAKFDSDIVAAAADAGAEVRLSSRVAHATRLPCRNWSVGVTDTDGESTLTCRTIVDATGRRAILARRLGGRACSHDRLVASMTFLDDVSSPPFALIEAIEVGWWYTAPIPGRRLVLAFLTDSDSCPRGDRASRSSFESRLSQAPLTSERVGQRELTGRVLAVDAHSADRRQILGDGWLAVGDAATAFDPLSGQGVYRALHEGICAADAIQREFLGDATGLIDYESDVRKGFKRYLEQRSKYYNAVTRWPDSQFWKRRA